jgi:hypothetical protein
MYSPFSSWGVTAIGRIKIIIIERGDIVPGG